MNKEQSALVSFKPNNGQYMAYLPMDQFLRSDRNMESVLKEAAQLYEHAIVTMLTVVTEIETFRRIREPLPARKIWRLGDLIFQLIENLEKMALQIDGIYGHLVRDLSVKRKWLEKVIIFRRYLPSEYVIPETLNWGRFEKGTRRAAENLLRGIIPG